MLHPMVATLAPCCASAEPLRPPVEPEPLLGVARCR